MHSPTSRRPGLVPSGVDRRLAIPLMLLAAVFAMRWPFLGHPMLHVDEQFYLLAGERIAQGWTPYVDFWDRKPVGLFLIYGAIRLLGGDGVVQYQIVSTFFAAATAYVIFLIARRGVSAPAAFGAAIAYSALLAPINGAGGQSPVFYNLFMASSALLVLRAGDAAAQVAFRRYGLAAMLCAGLAMQVKYLALIEGMFFGIWLLASGRRRASRTIDTAANAALFAGAALAPTCAAIAWFAAAGALEPFLQANFISIFERGAAPAGFERDALGHTIRMLVFALIFAAGALALMWLRRPARDRLFLSLWLAFATAGFFAIGNYYDHYALPLLVPLAVVLSRLFSVSVLGPLVFALLTAQGTIYGLHRYSPTAEGKALTAAMTSRIAGATRGGECLFVADAPIVLYLTTRACGPWRYSFPFHLIDGTEAGTGDSDQGQAMQAILASRPGVIVTGSPHFTPTVQAGNLVLLQRSLAAHYIAEGRYPDRGRTYTVWIRRDLSPGSSGRLQPTSLRRGTLGQ